MKKHSRQLVRFHANLRHVGLRVVRLKPDVDCPPPDVTDVGSDDPVGELKEPETPSQPTQHLETMLADLQQQFDTLFTARAQNISELHEIAVELAVMVASHVVKQELDAGQLNLKELVRQAIEQLLPATKLVIHLNPEDANDLAAIQADLQTGVLEQLDLIQDAAIPRGGCLVANEEHGLFSTLEARLENIRDTLLQGIEYARTERRKTLQVGSTLRRFPDRRKPA